ncbi:hypothetical protein ACHAXH_000597, partial [Discostella pseudostelligera]
MPNIIPPSSSLFLFLFLILVGMTIVPGTSSSSEPFKRQGGLIRHHSRGGEMHQQDNLAPSPSAAGGTIGTPSSSSSSVVLTPTMINNEAHFDYIPTTQDRRKLPPAPTSCLDNNNTATCPACHFTKTCCMQQNYRIYEEAPTASLSCSSNSFEVLSVGSLEVFDVDANPCNCNSTSNLPTCSGGTTIDCNGLPLGTYMGGCTSTEDTVEVRFRANFKIKNIEYDLGLYINTRGGSADTDTDGCVIQGLSNTDDNDNSYPIVGNVDGDNCLDASATGTLLNYPFPKLTLKCIDPNNDGLLDFSLGVSFSQNGGFNPSCDVNGPMLTGGGVLLRPPYPGSTPKCWIGGERITLAIMVPSGHSPTRAPTNTPTQSPSSKPTKAPTFAPTKTPTASPSSNP